MSIQSSLFATFAPHLLSLPPTELKSVMRRDAALRLIMLNFSMTFNAASFSLTTLALTGNTDCLWLLICDIILVGLSFLCLYRGDDEKAKLFDALCIHTLYFITAYYMEAPPAVLCVLPVMPIFFTFISMDKKQFLFFMTPVPIHYACYSIRTMEIFKAKMDDEHTLHGYTLVLTALICLITSSAAFFVTKDCEQKIWDVSKIILAKSERLTNEVIDILKFRDAIISLISTEIKDSLSSVQIILNHLIKTTSTQGNVEMIKDIRINLEMIHNIILNIIDVSTSGSNQDNSTENLASMTTILGKIFTIQRADIQRKRLTVQASISRYASDYVRINSPRVSQILNNIISTIIRSIQPSGRINILITFCPKETTREDLLKPIAVSPSTPGFSALPEYLRVAQLETRTNNEEGMDEFNITEKEVKRRNLSLIRDLEYMSLEQVCKSADSFLKPSNLEISFTEGQRHPRAAQGYVKIQITDNGCGLSSYELNTIFDIINNNQRTSSGDANLKLWLSRRLCQRMDGDICAYSALDQGTTFVLYLPVDNSLSSLPSMTRLRPHGKVSVLVVDDYDFNRDLHKLLLEKEGVHVTVASDGQEALDKYTKYGSEYFDFILMDIRMPVMDGLESTKHIRLWEHEHNKKKVEVCFLSGDYYTETELMNKLEVPHVVANMDQIRMMRKPLDIELLRKIIKRHREKI